MYNNRMNRFMGGGMGGGANYMNAAMMRAMQAANDPFASDRKLEMTIRNLRNRRPYPQDNRITTGFSPDHGKDLYIDPSGFPHLDPSVCSKSADWLARTGEGDWTWFIVGDTSHVGLEFLQMHENLQSLWVAYKKELERNPSMTNLQRCQWVDQGCDRLRIPRMYEDDGRSIMRICIVVVLTEQIMRERANPPQTQVVVAPAAGAQTSTSTNTTTTNNTQNVQNNQQNHYYTINQAPAAPKQPQKLATCTSKMRAAAAEYLLVKAGPQRSRSDAKVLKLHEQLLEGWKDDIVHKLLAEKAMAAPPPPPPTPAPQQQQRMQPVVQYQQPQAVVTPQPQVQRATTTTTTTTQSFSSSGYNSGWQQQGGSPGNPTMQQQPQQQPGGMQALWQQQQQGGYGDRGSPGMPMQVQQDQMAMGMANMSLGGGGTGEPEKKKKKKKKKRPAVV